MERLTKRPLHKLDREVRTLLRIGLVQLGYEESIPDFAALNETVELAKWAKLHKVKYL